MNILRKVIDYVDGFEVPSLSTWPNSPYQAQRRQIKDAERKKRDKAKAIAKASKKRNRK